MKIVVEHHPDGYVAYPLSLKGVVVGQGDTHDQALADVTSAIQFHIETFGREVLEDESPVLEAVITEIRDETSISLADLSNRSGAQLRRGAGTDIQH